MLTTDIQIGRTSPVTHHILNEYDRAGNLLSVNKDGQVTYTDYDSLERKETITAPDGGKTKYVYDDYVDRVKELQQFPHLPDGSPTPDVTGYEYDAGDQVTSMTYPDGASVSSKYDYRINKLEQRTDGKGVVTKFNYNNRNLLEQVTYTAPCGEGCHPSGRKPSQTMQQYLDSQQVSWAMMGRIGCTRWMTPQVPARLDTTEITSGAARPRNIRIHPEVVFGRVGSPSLPHMTMRMTDLVPWRSTTPTMPERIIPILMAMMIRVG